MLLFCNCVSIVAVRFIIMSVENQIGDTDFATMPVEISFDVYNFTFFLAGFINGQAS